MRTSTPAAAARRAGAEEYFTYFKDRAGQGTCTKSCKGWYSYDIGSYWHVVALNTACDMPGVGGCSASSQVAWLKADLAKVSPSKCVLAVMHRPYWSNGKTVAKFKPLVNTLYAGGADVLLTGNAHLYARYAQQNPSSQVDTAKGVREFIVGMGGRATRPCSRPGCRTSRPETTRRSASCRRPCTRRYEWKYLQAYPVTSTPYTDTNQHGLPLNESGSDSAGTATRDGPDGGRDRPSVRQPAYSERWRPRRHAMTGMESRAPTHRRRRGPSSTRGWRRWSRSAGPRC